MFSFDFLFTCNLGVMTAVEVVVENLKKMSKQVSTPEEIAQVRSRYSYLYNPV